MGLGKRCREEGGSFGRVSDTSSAGTCLQPSLAREVLGLLTLYPSFELPNPLKLQPCLVNSAGFVEKSRGDPHKAGTLLATVMATSPQSWSHTWKGDRRLRLRGQEAGKAEPGNTLASSETRPGSVFRSEAS